MLLVAAWYWDSLKTALKDCSGMCDMAGLRRKNETVRSYMQALKIGTIVPQCVSRHSVHFHAFVHFRLINIVFSHSPKLIKDTGSRFGDWIPLFREDTLQRQWKHSRPLDTFKVPLCSVTISAMLKVSSVPMFMESLPFQLKLPTGKATNSGLLECKQ